MPIFFSRQSPSFFFRAFCHPELQIFPVRPQQVQLHSWIPPGPRHKSLCKPLPGTFRVLLQDPADLHQALSQQCISFIFTRKESFCGYRRKDNKASLVIFSSTVMWCLSSGLSPASPAGKWVSGHKGGWTMLPLQGSVGAVTQPFTILSFWKEGVLWGWLFCLQFTIFNF